MFKKLLLSAIAAITISSASAAFAADRYEFDKSHTNIMFFISHLGFSNTVGFFSKYDGYYTFDEKRPEKSKINVTLYPEGIRTQSPELDTHLQNADFFNTAKFPEITFKSKSVKVTNKEKRTAKVMGDLTILGVTKPAVLDVKFNKGGVHPYTKDYVTGFTAGGFIKRSDYGMNYGIPNVGDSVRIHVEVEGVKTSKAGSSNYNRKKGDK